MQDSAKYFSLFIMFKKINIVSSDFKNTSAHLVGEY